MTTLTKKHSRRSFLGIMGATAAGAGLSKAMLGKVLSAVDTPGTWRDRIEKFSPSLCRLCPGGCGLKVRTVNGMALKLDGNPYHPVNRGTLCPRGQAGLQSLYDPDRLIGPLRRVGPKGSGRWEEISWEEGFDTVLKALQRLRENDSPERLAILGGQYRGMIDRLWTRLAQCYGTPNYIRLRTLKPDVPSAAATLMHGETRPISFDLRETNLVLSFGCNWLESWNSPVYQLRAYGHMRQGRGPHRGEIIHVEPRLSHSGAKADLWVPVKPGTEGAFALGLAHLILREQLYDDNFVNNNTFGFEDWEGPDGRKHAGFKSLVLADYSLARVSEITDVRPETIVTVARKFATTRPAVALGDNRAALEEHDLFTQMAIHSLNALVGSIGVRGGVMAGQGDPPLSPWPDAVLDETARRGLSRGRLDGAGVGERFLDDDVPRGLHEAILRGESSPVEVLIVHQANPLYGRPDKDLFRKALAKIPLVVSLSGVADEVSDYADLILPEHHFLEEWHDDVITHLPGFTLFGIGKPAVKPLYNTRSGGDIVLTLAKAAGSGSFPWRSYEDLLKDTAKGLFESKRGYVVSSASDELLRQVLQRQGYRAPEFDSFDKFWNALVSSGAWWEPLQSAESVRMRFATPSQKFEFYPQLLEARLDDAVSTGAPGRSTVEERRRILATLSVDEGADEIFFPHRLLTRKTGRVEFPLYLQTYEHFSIGSGPAANLPWLQENLAVHVHGAWGSWIEIHPDTATQLGIYDGDWVSVESQQGRIRVRARLYAGTRPDVVSIAVGQGHVAGGRWAKGRGVDASDLISSTTDPGEGFGIRQRTRVKITRA